MPEGWDQGWVFCLIAYFDIYPNAMAPCLFVLKGDKGHKQQVFRFLYILPHRSKGATSVPAALGQSAVPKTCCPEVAWEARPALSQRHAHCGHFRARQDVRTATRPPASLLEARPLGPTSHSWPSMDFFSIFLIVAT